MFLTLALTLGCSIAIGLAFRGRIGRLADWKFRMLPVLYASLLLGLLPLLAKIPSGPARAVVAVANLGVIAFLAVNVRAHRGLVQAGLIVAAVGWALNAIVILANAGMPLSEWAYAQSGQTDPITAGTGGFFKIVVADSGTTLPFLGDVIPIQPIAQVLSIGDLLLLAGIGMTIVGAMRGTSDQRAATSA